MLAEVRRATMADSDAVANIVREEIHAEEEAALEHARGAIRREVEALIGAFKSNMEATVTKGGLDLKTSLHRTVEQRVANTGLIGGLQQSRIDPDVWRTHDQRRYTTVGATVTHITRGYGVAGRTIRL